ncbi:MAG: NAD-dependent epimerase/dehydratase family protein [Rhizobiaceae bacterium]|nr:NAD-dependent epimerase/dehydratase family protein [Rhizobiaceae bacterium]
MKALVTGANGHIGRNLVRALAERGYQVRAAIRSLGETGRDTALPPIPGVEPVELDIHDADRFRALCDQIDILFHLAASHTYYPGTRATEEDIVADSVKGAETAIRAAARQVRKVVLTSSLVAVPLRVPGEPPATEADWQTDFSVPYFRARTESERQAWDLADKYAVELVTLLPGAVCGPGFSRGTPSTDVIEGILCGTLRFGAPRMTFPIVDMRDVVRGHILAAEKPVNGRFILCGDSFPTLREISQRMHGIDPAVPAAPYTLPDFMGPLLPYLDWLNSKLHDSPISLTPDVVEAMLGRQFNASNARARAELGWAPEFTITQTLSDTMDTIRQLRRSARRKA